MKQRTSWEESHHFSMIVYKLGQMYMNRKEADQPNYITSYVIKTCSFQPSHPDRARRVR